jgi:FMN phosphatase YigB (HAD superfamily)
MPSGLAVFFDIGDTLASAVVFSGRLSRLEVFPFVPDVLARLREAGGDGSPVSVGLLSNTGDETADRLAELLEEAGLSDLVDEPLCLFSSVEGVDKSQPAFFHRARERAGLPVDRCIFVGEDARERAVATSAGFGVSFHPLHALHLVERMSAVPNPVDHLEGTP